MLFPVSKRTRSRDPRFLPFLPSPMPAHTLAGNFCGQSHFPSIGPPHSGHSWLVQEWPSSEHSEFLPQRLWTIHMHFLVQVMSCLFNKYVCAPSAHHLYIIYLQIQLSQSIICNIYHLFIHYLPVINNLLIYQSSITYDPFIYLSSIYPSIFLSLPTYLPGLGLSSVYEFM